MSALNKLGAAPKTSTLIPEEVAILDQVLADWWTTLPAEWKSAITSAQLETLVEGMLRRALTERPTIPTGRAIQYLLQNTQPNPCGSSGGSGEVNISNVANNIITKLSDGLYAPAPAWSNKEW